MNQPRIVSLLPSATEVICALGLKDALVGCSHECDYPSGLTHLPALTQPRLDINATSEAIDNDVKSLMANGLSIYEVDAQTLRELRPDFIVTQDQCDVCAVTPNDLQQALRTWTGGSPEIVSLSPNSLPEVWQSFRDAANALGRASLGDTLVGQMEQRVSDLAERTARPEGERPRVACVEWIQPLMAAGNWVPELVEAAGGVNLFTTPGTHSPWLEPDGLKDADPDYVIIMPCGFDQNRAANEARAAEENRPWLPERAKAAGRIAVTDGHQFFNRPGPRLVDSLEIMVDIIQPDLRLGHQGEAWAWLRLPETR